jgi:hypothetical protein
MIAILVKLIVLLLITWSWSELVAGYSVNTLVVLCFLLHRWVCNLIYGVLYYNSFLWWMVIFEPFTFFLLSLFLLWNYPYFNWFLLDTRMLPRYRWDQLMILAGDLSYLCSYRHFSHPYCFDIFDLNMFIMTLVCFY